MQISRALGDVHLYTKTWEPRSAIEWGVERIGGGGFPGILIGRDPSVSDTNWSHADIFQFSL
jgi:hypothetical protein